MEAAEIEFLGEHEPIEIVPNFKEGLLYLLEGEVGPFRPGLPVKVPLWIGVHLRQRLKCRILQPDWMRLEPLETLRDEEKESQFFLALPNPHLFTVSQMLLDVATPEIVQADAIKTLLKDLWDIRQAKLRKSVHAFIQSGLQHAKLDHLQLIELNAVRPLLPQAMDAIFRLEMANSQARRLASQSTLFNHSTSFSSL